MSTKQTNKQKKWVCFLESDFKKLWGLSHLVVIRIRIWGPACESRFMCKLWSQQLVSQASTRTLLRTAPSPNPHTRRNMHLACGSCPLYAHCNICNFTQHSWMKIVLLQIKKSHVIGNKRGRPGYDLRGATKCIHPEVSLSLWCHSSWNCTRDPNLWVHQYYISKNIERTTNTMHCS